MDYNNANEWEGSKPKRFNGGKCIVQADYKSCTNFFHSDPLQNSNTLNIKSKKHFEEKKSATAHEWKPCLKLINSASSSLKPQKITDLPCTTNFRPLRHVEKFASQSPLIDKKKLKGSGQNRLGEDLEQVKGLENWEKNILLKKKLNYQLKVGQFKSVLEGHRTNAANMTIYSSRR